MITAPEKLDSCVTHTLFVRDFDSTDLGLLTDGSGVQMRSDVLEITFAHALSEYQWGWAITCSERSLSTTHKLCRSSPEQFYARNLRGRLEYSLRALYLET
jgi:hypothetical protein